MTDTIAAVKEFMLAANQEVKEAPGKPSKDVLNLRLSLELEELYEKAQAFGLEGTFCEMLLAKVGGQQLVGHYAGNWDTPPAEDTGIYNALEVLDAAADQRVVADGTILACGLQDVFPAAMQNVHESNMSKFCNTRQECHDTVEHYKSQGIKTCGWAHKIPGAKWIVQREPDGKILKSINYKPANMQAVLDNYYKGQ